MMKLSGVLRSLAFVGFIIAVAGCTQSATRNVTFSGPPTNELPQSETQAVVLPIELKTIVEHQYYSYPEITLLLAVKDVQETARKVKAAGGRIVYDPNRGSGSAIGFLIADLPPEKVLDDTFVKSLDLKAITLENDPTSQVMPVGTTPPQMTSLSVPIHEINVPEVRARKPGRGLGEGITVAVIDTGVDASHPAFQDRVVYWQDMTREGDFAMKMAKAVQGQLSVGAKEFQIPNEYKSAPRFAVGVISEKAMGVQISEESRASSPRAGLDLNQNQQTDDSFIVIAAQDPTTEAWVAFVDVDGDGALSEIELKTPIMDFNQHRKLSGEGKVPAASAFVHFPSRNRTIRFPLVLHVNAAGDLEKGTIAADFESHGTHVAGIIGADGPMLQGAAPKAKFMSLKVCSGISCTSGAIIRGLVESFYNPSGITADVVNISLGSQQGYTADLYSYLIRDLAAKFGAVFFISASNSGAGFRSI
ncbi:MAG: S8 family serine peptidase, partial [Bdellovibrionales bacterium]|nr:S8 family serine peptidase [Bdellovibrionales bacterium]